MRKILVIAMVAASLSSISAFADWATVGVASRCTDKAFLLESVVVSSAGSILPSNGATKLPDLQNNVQCSIGNLHIEADVFVASPGQNGQCGDAGTVWISSVKINDKNYLETPDYMNNYCTSRPTYSRLEVRQVRGKWVFRVCRGTWDWGTVFENQKCIDDQIDKH